MCSALLYNVQYTLSEAASQGEVDVYDINNAKLTLVPPSQFVAADLTTGSHSVVVQVPPTAVGPLTFLVCAQDNDAASDRGSRMRYALQQGQCDDLLLVVSPNPSLQYKYGIANDWAWNFIPGQTAYTFQRSSVPLDSKNPTYTWQTLTVPQPVNNGYYWYTFDPNINNNIYSYQVLLTNSQTIASNIVIAGSNGSSPNGWNAYPNPENTFTFDWTGFDWTTTNTPFNSTLSTSADTPLFVAGQYGNLLQDNLSTGLVGDNGSITYSQTSSATLTNSPLPGSLLPNQGGANSTPIPYPNFLWNWSPPIPLLPNQTGIDFHDFPTPALFVLCKTTASMDVSGVVDPTKFTATGTITDGSTLPNSTTPAWMVSFDSSSYIQNGNKQVWKYPTDGTNAIHRYVTQATTWPQLPATAQTTSTPLSTDRFLYVQTKPSASLSITSIAKGNGSAQLNARLYEYAYPIHMTYPNIFYRPDLTNLIFQEYALNNSDTSLIGNQFVYSIATIGSCQIPAQIDLLDYANKSENYYSNKSQLYSVNDPGDASILWSNGNDNTNPNNLVGWLFEEGKTMQPYDPNFNLKPTTIGTSANPTSYSCNSSANSVVPLDSMIYQGASTPALTFQGLPAENGNFGNYNVKLQVRTNPGDKFQDSEVAHIQTFFDNDATNHPVSSVDSLGNPRNDLRASQAGPIWNYYSSTETNPQSIPNWYHYYTQVYPIGSPDFWASMSYTGQAGNSTDITPSVNPNTPNFSFR